MRHQPLRVLVHNWSYVFLNGLPLTPAQAIRIKTFNQSNYLLAGSSSCRWKLVTYRSLFQGLQLDTHPVPVTVQHSINKFLPISCNGRITTKTSFEPIVLLKIDDVFLSLFSSFLGGGDFPSASLGDYDQCNTHCTFIRLGIFFRTCVTFQRSFCLKSIFSFL